MLDTDRIAALTLDAMCLVCGIHCATYTDDERSSFLLHAWDDFRQQWIVEAEDLANAVFALGRQLGVDWEE